MTQEEIKSFIMSGCKYEYISYDHKAVLEDYKKMHTHEYKEFMGQDFLPDCYYMPNELKVKHKVNRIGKLRSIEFGSLGQMWRFKIGARYAKTYYADDFGQSVKPIISKRQDKFGLIKKGLAIELKK